METRLIELYGQNFDDIKNMSEESMSKLFNIADYPISKEDEKMDAATDPTNESQPDKNQKEDTHSYSEIARATNNTIRM